MKSCVVNPAFSKMSNLQGEYGEGDPDMEGEGEYEEEA